MKVELCVLPFPKNCMAPEGTEGGGFSQLCTMLWKRCIVQSQSGHSLGLACYEGSRQMEFVLLYEYVLIFTLFNPFWPSNPGISTSVVF